MMCETNTLLSLRYGLESGEQWMCYGDKVSFIEYDCRLFVLLVYFFFCHRFLLLVLLLLTCVCVCNIYDMHTHTHTQTQPHTRTQESATFITFLNWVNLALDVMRLWVPAFQFDSIRIQLIIQLRIWKVHLIFDSHVYQEFYFISILS